MKTVEAPVVILYKDHLLFRQQSKDNLSPPIRETIVWVFKETEDAVYLLLERPANIEEFTDELNGMVILKGNILYKQRTEG